jgi:thymidine phosphorylase
LLVLTGREAGIAAARKVLDEELASGRALAKFREMVAAQGGNLDRLPQRAEPHHVSLDWSGYVHSIDTQWLGMAIIELGGGRKVMTDKVDHTVGLEMLVRIGDHIEAGQPVVRVFASAEGFSRVRRTIVAAFTRSDTPVAPPPLIVERIS